MRAPADSPECEQRSGATVWIAHGLVLSDRLLQQRVGLIEITGSGGKERAASHRVREHPFAPDAHGVRLPPVDDAHGVLDSPELEKKLGVVGGPPTDTRLPPSVICSLPLGLCEPVRGHRLIAAP